MRKFLIATLLALAVLALLVPTAGAARAKVKREYVVRYDDGVSLRAAKTAVNRIGGKVVRTQKALRIMLVTTRNVKFAKAVRKQRVLSGAARNQAIGRSYSSLKRKNDAIEREGRAAGAGRGGVTVDAPDTDLEEPLADWQWDMRMIGATPEGSYAEQQGSKDVIVAVIDTGIDGSHPDIAPNFNRALSRNWTTDIPLIDGPCNQDPDHSCQDPNNVDEDGHGTHVAGTIASPINGFGMAGVAPKVTLVNDRAGQDSGFFFLWETVNALKYAGDIGADVANMSFYTDPWQFNCPMAHPALDPETGLPSDSMAERTEQQTVLNTIDDAVSYARAHGVTLIAAAGNTRPILTIRSPTSPARTSRPGTSGCGLSPTGAAICRTRRTTSPRPPATTCFPSARSVRAVPRPTTRTTEPATPPPARSTSRRRVGTSGTSSAIPRGTGCRRMRSSGPTRSRWPGRTMR